MHLTATSHTPTTGPRFSPTVQTSQSYFRGSIHFRFSLWLLLVLREKTRSPDCARRHLDSQNTTHSNIYNTIYWLLKRTKSNRLYLYLMSCVSLRYPLEKTVEQLLGAWLFSQVHRLGCLLRERISLATLSFYNVISKSVHTRTFCPWRKQKKSSPLELAIDSNPRKQAILKPFWLYLRISWDHFSSGCVSLTRCLNALASSTASTVCGLHCRVRARCAQSQILFARFVAHIRASSLPLTPQTATLYVR